MNSPMIEHVVYIHFCRYQSGKISTDAKNRPTPFCGVDFKSKVEISARYLIYAAEDNPWGCLVFFKYTICVLKTIN